MASLSGVMAKFLPLSLNKDEKICFWPECNIFLLIQQTKNNWLQNVDILQCNFWFILCLNDLIFCLGYFRLSNDHLVWYQTATQGRILFLVRNWNLMICYFQKTFIPTNCQDQGSSILGVQYSAFSHIHCYINSQHQAM